MMTVGEIQLRKSLFQLTMLELLLIALLMLIKMTLNVGRKACRDAPLAKKLLMVQELTMDYHLMVRLMVAMAMGKKGMLMNTGSMCPLMASLHLRLTPLSYMEKLMILSMMIL
jgi:hypothetical protein